nr:ribonuclease H-like domain, reverse transcriptase, RNA-dependent DNA polymerase [Tanacetum cinerariifolium]
RGHFARDCRSARNSGNRSGDAKNAGYSGRNGKRPVNEEDENILVVLDGLRTYDWSYQVEEEATDFALMTFTLNLSSSSSLNSKLDEALKEKDDLKAKLKKFETSSKNLTKLLDSQISAKVKTFLGYDSQYNEKEVLDEKEEEVTETVFDNRSSDEENSLANDRFKKGEGYQAVPPPLTGNFMPPKSDLSFAGLDDSIYKFKISEIVTSLTKDEKDAPETSNAYDEKPKEDNLTKDEKDAPETSNAYDEKPKEDKSTAPLIQNWDTDSDNDSVFRPEHIPPKIDFVKADESVKHVALTAPTPQREGSGSGPGHQETIKGAMAKIRSEGALIQSIDPPLSTGYTVGSGEDRMEHDIKLMDIVPQIPHDSPLSKGHTPGSDDVEDDDTEMIVEDKGNGEKGGSTAKTVSTARPNISAARPEDTVEPKTPPTTTTLLDDEDVTIADILMKNQKAKEKGIAFKDVDDSTRPIRSITTLQPLPTIDPKDKAALTEMYDEVQAQIDADHELAVRLTLEEQEKYTVEERFTHAQLKSMSFEEIQKLRIKEQKCVDAFVPIGSEEDEKRIGSRKKRAARSNDDKAIDYETLDVKSLIVDCESQVLGTNEAGDVHVYKLTRLDGSYRHFLTFSRMLEVLDRKDVLDLHKIIMERFAANDPKEKRYLLTKEILEKMLSLRLEAETEKTQKPLIKDKDGKEVDAHMYRSMIGSLMYLTSSRPDIMFVVCACARYQVNPKVSHLHAVKRIFRKPRRKVTEVPQPSDPTKNVADEAVN